MSEIEALRVAIEKGDLDLVGRLLVENPSLADSHEKAPPPLHFAVYLDRPRMVELLLDHGASIESRDQDRDTTPLRYAIVYARKGIIRLLVARGASLGPKDEGGTTALDVARRGAAGGFEEYVELPSREEYREVVALLEALGAE